MSSKQIFRGGLMATAGVAALGLTACANSHATSARYGGTHYDYESSQSCGGNCGTSVVTAPAIRTAPVYSGTHYDYESSHNCGTSCNVGVTSHTGYTAPSYPSTPTYSTEVAPCPTGTTSQPDGTCLQNGGSHYTGYSSGTTSYTTGTAYTGSSYSSGSTYSSGEIAQCPAGTSAQPDGTCLQSGHGYSSYSSSSSTYAAPTTSTYSSTYVAPALTTECCGVGSTTVYTGPAATGTYGGYATSGSTYSSSDYLPIRK